MDSSRNVPLTLSLNIFLLLGHMLISPQSDRTKTVSCKHGGTLHVGGEKRVLAHAHDKHEGKSVD